MYSGMFTSNSNVASQPSLSAGLSRVTAFRCTTTRDLSM